MRQRVQLTSYDELNMPLTRQFRYALANARWRCSASGAQSEARDSSRVYANYVTVCINRCPKRLFEHTPFPLPLSLSLSFSHSNALRRCLLHDAQSCVLWGHKLSTSVFISSQATDDRSSLPLPSACHSHSTFKKLNATKCSCLMETLDGLAAAR